MSELSSLDIEAGNTPKPTGTVNDLAKSRIDNFDFNSALAELKEVYEGTAKMYQLAKKVKFDYIGLAGDIYSRMDIPHIIILKAEERVNNEVPSAREINKM